MLHSVEGQSLRSFDEPIVGSLRHMLTELMYSRELPRRIAMVAALRGEGVTYTSLALATTLANDLGRSVCLIELNWASPGLLAEISPAASAPKPRRIKKGTAPLPRVAPEYEARPGLAEVLTEGAALDKALMRTSMPNLTLLPAGRLAPERRPAVARGTGLQSLIENLGQRFDHLLLDVPAVLSTSDAIALASLGDACCVVVRHGITPTQAVQRALDDIKHLQMLGVVLNQVAIKTPRWIRTLIPQQ